MKAGPWAWLGLLATGPTFVLQPGWGAWLKVLAIMSGTFVSEDFTCLTVGLLINRGQLDWSLGIGACFLGIFLGDIGLWVLGRVVGRQVLNWKAVARYVPTRRLDGLAAWFDRFGFVAVFASRFMPGTRFPLYTTAGVLGSRARRFVVWALISDLIYTPLIVVVVAVMGQVVVEPMERVLGGHWLVAPAGAAVIFCGVRLGVLVSRPVGRAKLAARVSRLWRWEFWPSVVFYMPMFFHHLWMTLVYRCYTVWTCANPAIEPGGGIVGESKAAILAGLPEPWKMPTVLIEPADLDHRCDLLLYTVAEQGWQWPVVVKPDAAQRGVGLKVLRHPRDIRPYLHRHTMAVVIQPYHPGPYEAGVFYYRMPGQRRGCIFSLTDKHFPYVVGDGRSTVEQLIWKHSRYRMQARLFLKRHYDRRQYVPAEGEKFCLGHAGNHAQGACFRDGSHLITEALERTFDRIVADFTGFDIGRFDIRYSDVEQLKRGRGFKIIELNGITSESTNFYDPTWPLWKAYLTLCRQWSLAFAIGDRRRSMGVRPLGNVGLVRLLWRYYRRRDIEMVGD